MVVYFYGRRNAGLRVAIFGEHQRMRIQIIVWSYLRLDVWWRDVSPGFNDQAFGDMRDVEQSIGLDWIESVKVVVFEQLTAEPTL